MKILLTGITGQVGQELQDLLPSQGEIIGLGREKMDLAKPDSIAQVIEEIKPDVIVNASAYTAVDKAETEVELAQAINGEAPRMMAASATKLGAKLVHISTDYVFDGQKNTPYQEDDPTNPLGSYGKSKLAGEIGVAGSGANHVILRTAWVYGSRGHGNFVKTMLRLGKEREEIRVVADQVGSPSWSKDIAAAIVGLIESQAEGIYHFTNSGVASWYDLAVAIFEEAEKIGYPLKIQRVVPITTSEYPTPAKRPAYSVLSQKKITQVLGNYPNYWRHSLRKMLLELWEIEEKAK
ncbi:MAG: dTDP-4-dehydrorhamnose reductase [Gomphosphaeria aponina SAG 52.96 = DSM 107014]|uniref:dTDP-4-dehydrorhamnose reductase n=1 Tax=Gomphosphaeria aponina SAG 52.96 = DSM 107014 TaxID=1521640 RepID=A0A941GUB2_9CHRO|nr:dTDP-4-dehydrorhamnose reductase [Gomphosphaeria aponina SAG 52.96 = DSM 107014]